MKYEIEVYGSDRLRIKAQHVAIVDDEIANIVSDMLDTMYQNNGLGLAAEQVGRTEAICIVDVSSVKSDKADEGHLNDKIKMPLVLINPEITGARGEQVDQEGCLSFPDIYVSVARANEVDVKYIDLKGKEQNISVIGLLARAVQHEIDHLNGVLLVDKMTSVQRVVMAGKLKRLQRGAKDGIA